MKKYLLLFILLFTFTISVHAECEDPDLLNYASNLEIKYKEITGEDKNYIYYLYVNPKRDDIELSSTNSLYGGTTKSVEMENNIVIPSSVHYESKTYTIDVYVKSNAKTCAGELLTSLTYTVPPYNYYSNTQYCEDNPDLDICQRMADTKDMTNEEFAQKAKEYDDKNGDVDNRSLLEIILLDYLIWLLVPALIFGFVYNRKINKVKKVKENE